MDEVYTTQEDWGTCQECNAEDVDRRFKTCFACAMLEDPESDPSELQRALEIYEERGQEEYAEKCRQRLAQLN